jgi:hypothetical protein
MMLLLTQHHVDQIGCLMHDKPRDHACTQATSDGTNVYLSFTALGAEGITIKNTNYVAFEVSCSFRCSPDRHVRMILSLLEMV